MVNFSFTLKPMVKHRTKKDKNTENCLTKLIEGIVCIEDGIYKVCVKEGVGSYNVYEFTPKSYNLKGRTDIFTKVKSNFEKRIRYIRQESHAIAHPGNPEKYVPFAPRWIINGYIVSINFKKYFDFNQLLHVDGHSDESNITL